MRHAHSLSRRAGTELVGTAIFVFVAVGAVPGLLLLDGGGELGTPQLGFVALAAGFAVAALVYAIGPVSGCHVNPAVTVAFAASRRFPWREVPCYVCAQCAGATLGALAIWGVFGDRATRLGYGFGLANFDRATTGWGSALLAEALAAGILVFVVLGAIDRRAPKAAAGLVIGLGLAAIVLVLGPVTGSATNPARVLGPLLVQTLDGSGVHNWLEFLLVYAPAELAGGVLAALGYDALTQPAPARERARPARVASPRPAAAEPPRVRAGGALAAVVREPLP